jgi:hypothetical protein
MHVIYRTTYCNIRIILILVWLNDELPCVAGCNFTLQIVYCVVLCYFIINITFMVVPVLLCFGCLGFRDESVRAWLNIIHFLTGAFVTVGLSL